MPLVMLLLSFSLLFGTAEAQNESQYEIQSKSQTDIQPESINTYLYETRSPDYDETVPLDNQAVNARDFEIVKEIYAALRHNSSLSMHAKRVRITINRGTVTLRGSVDTMGEKNWIEAEALSTPGVFKVDNQLIVDWKG